MATHSFKFDPNAGTSQGVNLVVNTGANYRDNYEIKDVNSSFTFIVNNTKEGIMFEGNGDAKIDTPEFYDNIFKPFNFTQIKYLGHSQLRPAYKILK